MSLSPLILIIDDNQTVRKVVEGYLTQVGYRVLQASNAERGLELARTSKPDLILLDHQLPGTTGDQLCRRLLEFEETAPIPVVICSAMRNKAFVQYAEFANVVDQIPKPFTPESLRGGVANALQTGSQVVQAQRTGSAMPEADEDHQFDAVLQGVATYFPLRTVFDFLNNGRQQGRLIIEAGRDRLMFALAGGRIQAVYSPTYSPEALAAALPAELADLAPLLVVTLAERQDAQVSGLIRLLEKSLSDPRRVRALLRFQAAVLMFRTLTHDPGTFAFQPGGDLPPMFQAFPLHVSLPALSVEGVRRCDPVADETSWAGLVYRRPSLHGSNPDRAGLSELAVRVHTSLDGLRNLSTIAKEAGLKLDDLVNLIRGLELAGLVSRRADATLVLVIEDDTETVAVIEKALKAESPRWQYKVAQDRVGAQLLLRRARFDIVLLGLDGPGQEETYSSLRAQTDAGTRFIGLAGVRDEEELLRLDSLGLDGIIERPVAEGSVKDTIKLLIEAMAQDPKG